MKSKHGELLNAAPPRENGASGKAEFFGSFADLLKIVRLNDDKVRQAGVA